MKQNNKSNWLLWVLLIFLPPFGILYMWIAKNEMDQKKKKTLSIVFAVWFLLCVVIGSNNETTNNLPAESNNSLASTNTSSPLESASPAKTNTPPDNTPEVPHRSEEGNPADAFDNSTAAANTASPLETTSPEETDVPPDSTPEVPHRSGEEIVGISDKDISEIRMNFVGKVRNDVTEKWRYSTTSEDIDIEKYALSYYEEYFENDNEIHGIVNFTRKTTARLNVYNNMIFLSLYEHVDGEEHDAKIMFSGTPLADYIIYMDNGDIEKSE